MKIIQHSITDEINKLEYSPSFQINFIELLVKERGGKFSIVLAIGYENINNQNEFIRELKVDYTGPSFAQAKIKAERLQKEAVSKKPIKLVTRA